MITVYQADDSIFRDSISFREDGRYNAVSALLSFAEGNYTKVANVDTDDVDIAYELTNSIDTAWYETMRMTGAGKVFGTAHRSTSVGDILKVADGGLYIVGPIGFVEL